MKNAVGLLSLLAAACNTGGGGNLVGSTPAPRAADDVFAVALSSRNNDLDVLRNDGGVRLTQIPETTALGGSLRRIENGTPNDLSDDLVRYTPPDQSQNPNPATEDSFDYSVSDSAGKASTARVTLKLSDRPCLDRETRLASGLGYCFDAHLVTVHDGTKIDLTAYIPHPDALAKAAGLANGPGYAPLVLHGHGYGGSKTIDFSIPTQFVDNQAARKAWDAGYFVISFTQRGFGGSGGEIGLMNPALEGKDANELVDWAIKHFREDIYGFTFDSNNPEHTSSTPLESDTRRSLLRDDVGQRLSGRDPALGTLGYSYGGGFQYTAAHADTDSTIRPDALERFDALIPEGTWFDLRYSLHSNQVPKTAWLSILQSFSVRGGNGEPLPPFLAQGFAEAEVAGKVSAANLQILKQHSASFYCDPDPQAGTTTHASLFHIQGFRDTLFNFNEAYDNALCFERAGNDVRLLIGVGGHPLPALTPGNYTGHNTSMDIDEVVHCTVDGAPRRLYVSELMFAFLEEKLRGVSNAAAGIPKVCIVQENTDPDDLLVDDHFTDENTGDANHYKYPKEGVVLDSVEQVLLGAGDNPPYVCDTPADVPQRCAIAATSVNVGPQGTSAFVKLYTVVESRLMAGIPTVRLSVNRLLAPQDPIFFVATAIRRDGQVIPLHDQLTPVRDTAAYPFEANDASTDGQPIFYGCAYNATQLCERGRLVGVSVRLLPGDEVGLQFSGSQPQYQNNGSKVSGVVTISGDAELPILAPSPLPPSLN